MSPGHSPNHVFPAPTSAPSRHDVGKMFDRIAPRYDLLNHLLSGGIDLYWRRQVSLIIGENSTSIILDLATGTADQLLSISRHARHLRHGIGMDISMAMLTKAREKITRHGLETMTSFAQGSAMALPLGDNVVDIVTISFGLRNFTEPLLTLKEIKRVLKVNGKLIILEFGLPKIRLFRSVYLFYFRHVLPLIGALLSRDRNAYRYLNRTVETFPFGREMCALIQESGFRQITLRSLTGGIAFIYQGIKLAP